MTARHTTLMTDRYEFSMLTSLVNAGTVNKQGVFEVFARRLPNGRRFGLLAGTGRLIELIKDFRFTAEQMWFLLDTGVIDLPTAEYLRDFQFTGTIRGLAEGDVYAPGTPVLTVDGTLGEGFLLETLVLSILNHDTAIASAAARMVLAADGRPIIEMGSRRIHEEAAVAAARAAFIAGFAATSNLAAGFRYGIPATGTAAHAFTLAHASEREAFRNQVRTHGPDTTLLVDTYDIATGIRNAVDITADEFNVSGPGAVRIDSGDLAEEAHEARALLDSLGATKTRITVTSDLDEYVMSALRDAPIDGYGAGTRVATGSGHPTAGFVYKLVAVEGDDQTMRPVAKKAAGKGSVGGSKDVYRSSDLTREVHFIDVADDERDTVDLVPVQETYVLDGRFLPMPTLEQIRAHAAETLALLPPEAREMADGSTYLTPTVFAPRTDSRYGERGEAQARTLEGGIR